MKLRFELTMPNCGSWDGIDHGKKEGCFKWASVPKEQALKLLNTNHYYSFGDGWGANVKVTNEKGTKTSGFRGYDWMVDEILTYGRILTREQRRIVEANGIKP